MGYKVLVTLDLSSATDDQRKEFYKVLDEEKWLKINSLTTTWKISFQDNVDRDGVIETLKNDMHKAKNESKVKKVEYAMQMDKPDVIVSYL
jgi:hypothetical protein